ncbi:MAG: hypothetical protein II837_07555 [Treponema sp.]|nr:hypothetical protein [Treponema sp.]MBQ7167990.1 hypothetical protein [Treponema sp.]
MSYKIALASSDGVNVDEHFGAASSFLIYEVSDEGEFSLLGRRDYDGADVAPAGTGSAGCNPAPGGCASGSCGGQGNGCGQGGAVSAKVLLVSDCRSVVAARIGFNVTKQLERKAISGFDVECTVQEALEKITKYFHSVDKHVSLARR